MSKHIMIKEIDQEYADKFSDYDTEYNYYIICPEGNGCDGWIECSKEHTVPGYDGANDGPYESEEDAPWDGHDEFEFHGEWHEWKWGYGWTVEYPGCVVQGQYDLDPPDELYSMPPGRYIVEDDWDDTTCYLQYVGPEEEKENDESI